MSSHQEEQWVLGSGRAGGSKSSPVSEIHVWENTHPLPIAHSLHEQPLSTRCRSS